MLRLLLSILSIFGFIQAIPVDNGVEGEPEIECGPLGMQITFQTRNPFTGRLYVKGHFDQDDCHNEQIGRTFTGISLTFGSCGVQRLRSLNPRGIFASTTVVISFHPLFVTKIDRVYHIHCFYMEADKTVNQQLEVSDLTTAFVTQLVPMPICRYEILEGGPTGQPVQFATIGQQVYHKWTCDTEVENTFCMVVHSCFVDDGHGDQVEMLNDEGCAQDRYVLNNLEYPADLMAGQEAHVFKYADRPLLFFQCQISITVKEPNSECARPQCPEPTRGKRETRPNINAEYLIDVQAQPINALDITLYLDSNETQPMPPRVELSSCRNISPMLFFAIFTSEFFLMIILSLLFLKKF